MGDLWLVRKSKPPAPVSVFVGEQTLERGLFCHVCLEGASKLSYEHIPPKAAFNTDNRTWHTLPLGENVANPNQLRQVLIRGGFRRKTLCTACNTRHGSSYAREYVRFARYLDSAPIILDERGDARLFTAPFNRLLLAKEIATMILALENPGFALKQERLRSFALNPKVRMDPGFRIFAFLVPKRPCSGALQPYQGRVDLNNPGKVFLAGEISHYPLGVVYATKLGSGYRPDKLTEITAWFKDGVEEAPLRLHTRLTVIESKAIAAGFPREKPQLDRL